MLTLPHETEVYEQLRLTIDKAWKINLTKIDIERWLYNFKGEVFKEDYEKKIALYLLNNFVFYNEKEVRHLCKILFWDLIHHITIKKVQVDDKKSINDIYRMILQEIRFCFLGNQSESGGLISYYFRTSNNLDRKRFLQSYEKLPTELKIIVFLEDVVITGSQFQMFLENADLKIDTFEERILLTFISTERAIELLKRFNIKVISSIILDDRNKCFSPNSYIFSDLNHLLNDAKKIALHYGKKLMPTDPLGFENGEYAFGFFYNIPDNCLPIFWSTNSGWNPIFKRYHKKYFLGIKEEIDEFRRFI